MQYNRVVTQRNKLLKELSFRPEYEDTLDVWDMQMVQYGAEVMQYRREFVEELNHIILSIHSQLSGGKEEIRISYEPNTAPEIFADELKRGRAQDIRQKTSLSGPHRDDISFHVNGIDIRKFGSQGQQRTAALSLKLAEIEIVRKIVKDYPILLLDDVLSELDGNRQNQLLGGIGHIQTVITCTGLDEFVNHRFPIDKVFRVASGTVTSEN